MKGVLLAGIVALGALTAPYAAAGDRFRVTVGIGAGVPGSGLTVREDLNRYRPGVEPGPLVAWSGPFAVVRAEYRLGGRVGAFASHTSSAPLWEAGRGLNLVGLYWEL